MMILKQLLGCFKLKNFAKSNIFMRVWPKIYENKSVLFAIKIKSRKEI